MKTFAIMMLAAGATAMAVKESSSKITFSASQLALLKKIGQEGSEAHRQLQAADCTKCVEGFAANGGCDYKMDGDETAMMAAIPQFADIDCFASCGDAAMARCAEGREEEKMKRKDARNYEKYGKYEKYGEKASFGKYAKYKQFAWRGKFAKYHQYEDRKCFGFAARTCEDLCTVCIDSTDPACEACAPCEKYIDCLPQDELCKCRPPSDEIVLRSEHKDLKNILSYGASCRAHDLNPGTPWVEYCPTGSPWCKESHNWCVEQWCYVSEYCDSAVPTSVFAPAALFYSYETCGNPDCFNEYAEEPGCPYSDAAKRCDACECTGAVPEELIVEAEDSEALREMRSIEWYGSECEAWDNIDGTPWKDYCPEGSPFCSRTHNWCTLPWCYVEKSCSTAVLTEVFAPATLFYSYDTCGVPDCYNNPGQDGCPYKTNFCTDADLSKCEALDNDVITQFLFDNPVSTCDNPGVNGYCGEPVIDFACPSTCKICGLYNYNIDNNEFLATAFNILGGCVSELDKNPNVCKENPVMPAVCPETCRSAQ